MSAEDSLRDAALDYHRSPRHGKVSVTPTKPLTNQRDLSLAYSPGVAYPCLAIEKDPTLAAEYTSRGNLVGVVTNGTAVLGLGDIGPLASKPVMEGKGCLFKKFAGIDVFDIEREIPDYDLNLFFEKRAFGGVTFRFDMRNANDRNFCRERTRFDGATVDGIVEEIENSCRQPGVRYSLKIRNTF